MISSTKTLPVPSASGSLVNVLSSRILEAKACNRGLHKSSSPRPLTPLEAMIPDSQLSSHSSFTIVYFFTVTWRWQLWLCFKIKIELRSRQKTLRARPRFCMARVFKKTKTFTNRTRDIAKRSQDWLKTSSGLVPHFWVNYFWHSGCHQHLGNLSLDPIHSMYSQCCCFRDTIESWFREILELGFTQVVVLVLVLKAKMMNLWVLTTTLCLRPNPTYMLSLRYMVHTNQYRGRPIYSSTAVVSVS